MTEYKIIMNGRNVIGSLQADTVSEAIERAREYVKGYAKRAWRYDDAWPNSVVIASQYDVHKITQSGADNANAA